MDPLSARLRDRRPGALGDLHVLSDELLCAVLGFLSPLDLGRLACVSSVMYILCNEEPLWMDKCLSSFPGLLEYRGSWKKTTLQNLGAKNNEACQKPLRFDGFNSLFLYRRWYRCFTKLSAFSSDNGDLERKEELTFDEFRSEYDGKKPVLLTDLADGWPAKTKWTTDQLLSNYGDVAFRMSQRSSKKITMKFKDYVSYMGLQHDEEPLYIFDDKFGEAAPALLNDYSVPYLFQEDFFDVLDHDQRPPFRWILIGPERTGASWHVDPALTTAWNTLLCGRKRWALYPPGRVPAGVTVHVNEEDGDVNVESPTSLQWWLDIYPQLADHDKPLECTQQPGETIFVPSGWWHCVLNLETTIAVTQNFVNQTNFEFVCLDMAPGYHHKGVCLAGSLAAKDKDIGNGDDCTYFETKVSNHHNMNLEEKRLKRYKAENDPYNNDGNWLPTDGFSEDHYNSRDKTFSYDIDFLSRFLDEERDHYLSLWRPSNFIAQKNMRDWLHKLWIVKPTMRQLIWKGACLSINVEKWYGCLLEILACHNLPSPLDDEKLPVGTGHNPVFLIADYVIKLYVEGGLESSIYDLGTELEFYNLLHEVNTPLTEHVPDVVASGFVVYENSCYRAVSWDGNGVPGEIASCYTVEESCIKDRFPFGVWSKKLFEIKKSGALSCLRIWPYIVTQRFRGDTFAHLRDTLSTNDVLHLASFLGDQLRNLHLLPLPHFHNLAQLKTNKMPLWTRTSSCQAEGSEISTAHSSTAFSEGFHIAREWDLVIASLDERKINIRKRLLQWGDPIPGLLIEKAEEYLPDNLAYLFDLVKGDDGLYRICGSPSWVHLDIMDDNILMEQRMPTNCSDRGPPHADSIVSGETDPFNVEGVNAKWSPAHIIDFSYLSVGDPLYDLIPLYLDVFRGNICLLKHFLESYRLPLSKRTNHDAVVCESVENSKKFKRISYRAMCYCILHQDEILGAIFSLWKELRTATSWEEVEEAVWGELNNYQCPD